MTKKKKSKKEQFLVGYCAVDSGQILMIDPIYLCDFGNGRDYEECIKVTSTEGVGQVYNNLAVVSATGLGDGYYPVYVTLSNEIITKMEIRFDGGTTGSLLKLLQKGGKV